MPARPLRPVKGIFRVSTNNASRAAPAASYFIPSPTTDVLMRSDPRSFLSGTARTFGLSVLLSVSVGGQVPFSTTSAGRPIRSEDATAMDRYALDLYLAPVAVGRGGGASRWSFTPGLAYGLVPRTQIEVALPIGYGDQGDPNRFGVFGVDLSALYAFNVESRSLPAVALRAGVLMPVGSIGPQSAHEMIKVLATRTLGWGRLHFNHQYTFGDEPPDDAARPTRFDGPQNLSRWTTGLAVDRALPLRGLLVSAEAFARRGIAPGASTEWNAGAGARYQLTAATTADVGVRKSLTGDAEGWAVSVGLTRTMAVRSLIPGLGTWGR
jgi:hypothetical protein